MLIFSTVHIYIYIESTYMYFLSENNKIQKTSDYRRGTGGRKSAPIIERVLDSLTHRST